MIIEEVKKLTEKFTKVIIIFEDKEELEKFSEYLDNQDQLWDEPVQE